LRENFSAMKRSLSHEGKSSNLEYKEPSKGCKEMARNKKISAMMAVSLFGVLALAPAASAATPTYLTTTQKAQLKYLIEEEKLARDVYTYLAGKVTTRKFSNIARSEQTHMNYVASLLAKYKQTNPTTGKAAGVFVNKDIQALYNTLIAEGAAGQLQAFAVGVKVEQVDIASIKELLLKAMPADVKAALDLMLAASNTHLEAFTY
jgi:hypothetical protein